MTFAPGGGTLTGVTVYASDGRPKTDDTAPAADEAAQLPNDPAPPVSDPEPEVEVLDAESNDADNVATPPPHGAPKPGTALVESNFIDVVPEFVHQQPWPYEWIDFEGDRLGFRIPRGSAVTGFSNSQSKYVPNREKGDTVQLFLRLHLSPESYDRVMFRMMHPESDYTLFTLAKLVEAILAPGVKQLEAELEAAGQGDDKPGDGKSS